MLLNDLNIRKWTVQYEEGLPKEWKEYHIGISAKVVIKRDGKFYQIEISKHHQSITEKAFLDTLCNFIEKFMEEAQQIHDKWEVQKELEYTDHRRMVGQEEFILEEEV